MLIQKSAAGTTTRLIMTTHLRASTWLRQRDPLMVVMVALILGAVGAGFWLERPQLSPALAPRVEEGLSTVLVFATNAPTAALPTVPPPTSAPAPTTAPGAAPEAAAAPITVQSAPQEPTPDGYVAHTTQGEVYVPNDATPVPADQPYTGLFLAPAQPWTPPAGATRYCTGFGDWRDYDAAYAASPVCMK